MPQSKKNGTWVDTPARREARAKGSAKPGEQRRNNFTAWLKSEADVRAEVVSGIPGNPSRRELDLAKFLAREQTHNDRLSAWLGVNSNNQSREAGRKLDLVIKSNGQIAKLYELLHQATQERIAAAQRPNAGQPVRPRRDSGHVSRVALLLLKQGALPGASSPTRALARKLVESIESDRKNHKAVDSEFATLPVASREAR